MTRQVYSIISLSMVFLFGIVGLAFLLISESILKFFNSISVFLGMQEGVVAGTNIYVILAVAYMYLVALFAYFMYQNPGLPEYPFLLMNGKFATAILSIGLFFAAEPLFIYLANGVIDGLIGVLAMVMYRSAKKETG